MKLKVFSDATYIPAGRSHSVMLYPFWGKSLEDPGDPSSGRFDRYMATGRRFFEMTSLDQADFAVLPVDWGSILGDAKAMDLARQFVEKASQAGKPTVIFFWSDSDEDIPIKNVVVFRTSLYRSRRKSNELAMPAWSEDFVSKHLRGKLPVRPKAEKPIVGFCGYAFPWEVVLRWRAREILRRGTSLLGIRKNTSVHPLKPGHVVRAEALRFLSRSPLVRTNFIIRDRFLGGAVLPDGRTDLALMRNVRLGYLQNMIDSDYVLCSRGGGNYSYRLYETVCCGRIPIFIDTDCVLPYDFDIEWKKYCVWVDESELPHIAEKVARFHSDLSPGDFVELQHMCRRLWEEWLSPEGFFANFYRLFASSYKVHQAA